MKLNFNLSFESLPSRKSGEVPRNKVKDWIEMLREFNKKNEQPCCDVDEDVYLKKTLTEQKWVTGSRYRGYYNVFGINGRGTYTFPDGVKYVGEFKDGVFHGKGKMTFNCGTSLRGIFSQGLVMEPTIVLEGELDYDDDLRYCAMPDRRFCIERKRFIKPDGLSYLTNQQPTREIPDGYYDTGSGFFDPLTKGIVKYDDLNTVRRLPEPDEQEWMKKHCRTAPDSNVGPCKKFYKPAQEIKTNLYDDPEYGTTGLMDYINPELEERLTATKKLLEKRVFPKTIPTRRLTIREFQGNESRHIFT